jgi:hypothetical protein
MKLKKQYVIPAIILGVGLIYIFRDKIFGKKISEKIDDTLPFPTRNDPTKVRNDDFPLKRGSKGKNVRNLQNALLKYDSTLLPKFGADGDFGRETEAAVLKVLNQQLIFNQAEIDKISAMKKSSGTGSSSTSGISGTGRPTSY